jgi:hypothetical protein
MIDSRLDKLMKGGIRRNQVTALTREIDETNLESGQQETVQEELVRARCSVHVFPRGTPQ